MKDTVVARRYAKALLEAAVEKDLLDHVRRELAVVVAAVQDTPGAERFFAGPRVPAAEKDALLKDMLDAIQASPVLRGFLHAAAEKMRLGILDEIHEEFKRAADRATGVVRATLTTAHDIDRASVERLRVALEKRTGRTVRLNLTVDSSLIGGAALQMESQLMDASIRGRLRQLREHLA